MSASTLFAIAVIFMVFSHIFHFFMPDQLWLRIPDRISVPVFLIGIGYNTGQRFQKTIFIGTALVFLMAHVTFGGYFVNILGTILLVRYTIEPLAQFMFKNKITFWGTHIVLLALYPVTADVFDYGTLAFIMALAGWINKNGTAVTGHIIKASDYFIIASAIYLVCMKIAFGFNMIEMTVIAAGLGVIMYLLYHMKTLLLNSIRHKPTDHLGRIIRFIGHKSLEIYIIHVLFFMAVVYYIGHIKA